LKGCCQNHPWLAFLSWRPGHLKQAGQGECCCSALAAGLSRHNRVRKQEGKKGGCHLPGFDSQANTERPWCRLASRGARLTVLAVLGLLAYWCTTAFPGKADPAELQARLSRLELECNTTCPACPACQEPACPTVEKGGCDQHGKYDLSHLNQVYGQDVGGPIMVRRCWGVQNLALGRLIPGLLPGSKLPGTPERSACSFQQWSRPMFFKRIKTNALLYVLAILA
jgi:hypothetical protein